MSKNYNLEDEFLDSIKGIQKATAPAFFYTRLMAKIEKERQQSPIIRFLTQPAFAMSVVALVLFLNVMTFVNFSTEENNSSNIQEIATVIASEYNITHYTVYDEITNE